MPTAVGTMPAPQIITSLSLLTHQAIFPGLPEPTTNFGDGPQVFVV
jgi:hypothetical protein